MGWWKDILVLVLGAGKYFFVKVPAGRWCPPQGSERQIMPVPIMENAGSGFHRVADVQKELWEAVPESHLPGDIVRL